MSFKLDKKLIKGSLILIIAFGFFNFFNFLFQLVMARMLSVLEYGVLAALFAIIYILMTFTESIQTIMTKFSSKETNKGILKNLLKKSSKKAFVLSIIFFTIYLLLAIPLSIFLKINYTLLALNGLFIFLALFVPITRGIMQGTERFKSLGVNMVIESSGKLIFGIIFVYIGWSVYGAIVGTILGGLLALVFSLIPLRDIIRSKEKVQKTQGIYNYAKPTFLITSMIIVFYSLDVILAKIFFEPQIAGAYAVASILGKIIFWGSLPVSKAMFPMSSNKKNKGKSSNIFNNAVLILALGIITALLFFYFFPELIIQIFSGKSIPESTSVLFLVGISFALISFTNLILLYKLSLGKINKYPLLFIFILIEIFLLSYFSDNLIQYSVAFITSSAIFLWGSVTLMND